MAAEHALQSGMRLVDEIRKQRDRHAAGDAICVSRGAMTLLSASEPGGEQVAHRVPEHGESVDDNRQAKPRPQGQAGRLLMLKI